MNLHIFNDNLGFFTNKTVCLYESLDPNHNLYLNSSIKCKNKKDSIAYSSVKDYLKTTKQSSLSKVFFHCYSYTSKNDIQRIKSKFPNSKIEFFWIFWSHELYQHPIFFSKLYKGFSRKFYLRKLISFHVEHFIKFFKGDVSSPFYLGFKSFQNSFKEFYSMCALIEDDYNMAMKGISNVKYNFISYVNLSDFPEIQQDFTVNKSEIMIGHSGSPILNHYEIVQQLADLNVNNDLYIPLAYGKKSYIKALKSKINQSNFSFKIDFQDTFIAKDQYYKRINNIGYFILNSHCQQALGNVFFFLWVGTKVFLNKDTSSYITLKKKNFYIYSIDDDLNLEGLRPLTIDQKEHNRRLVVEYINDKNVNKAWMGILNPKN